jgi:hypothetical protein
LKKQSQSPAFGVKSFAGERYENKSRRAGRLRENKANRRPSAGNPKL